MMMMMMIITIITTMMIMIMIIWRMIVYLSELVIMLRIKPFHSVLEVKENISLYTPCSCIGGIEV